MEKYLSAFLRLINIRQILNGLSSPLFGSLVYLIFPHPDQKHIPYKSTININKYTTFPNIIGQISNSLPSLFNEFLFILITAVWLLYYKIGSLISYTCWFLKGCIFELEKIFNSSFIKRIHGIKILKFKRISIFAILIFFSSILSVNVNYHHFVNSIYNDDCLFCDKVCRKSDNDSKLPIYDLYQIPLNDLIIFIPSTKNVFVTPYFLIYKFSARAPPS